MFRAAETGNVDVVRDLLDHGESPNIKQDAITPLLTAVGNGRVAVIKILLSYGASVNERNQYGQTALHIATSSPCCAVIDTLVSHEAYVHAHVTITPDNQGSIPIDSCPSSLAVCIMTLAIINHNILYGDVNKESNKRVCIPLDLRLALKPWIGTDLPMSPSPTLITYLTTVSVTTLLQPLDDCVGLQLIHVLAAIGNQQLLSILLQRCTDCSLSQFQSKHQITPMHISAYYGHHRLISLLLSHRHSLEAVTDDGWSPLHAAADAGHVTTVQSILQSIDKEETPGSIAVRVFCRRKIKGGWSPLHLAANNGHDDVINLLLNDTYKADIHSRDDIGWTPLHCAAYAGHVTTFSCFLSLYHGDYSCRSFIDSQEWTVLHVAAASGAHHVTNLLLSYTPSLDINSIDSNGMSALMISAMCQNDDVVTSLLTSPYIECSLVDHHRKWCALHFAIIGAHASTVTILIHATLQNRDINSVSNDMWDVCVGRHSLGILWSILQVFSNFIKNKNENLPLMALRLQTSIRDCWKNEILMYEDKKKTFQKDDWKLLCDMFND